MTSEESNYVETYLPPRVVEKLEAGAFRSLCSHLKERSDQVQNIDLMTLSGFCRNCLAKWMVVEARRLSDMLKENPSSEQEVDLDGILQALDALGYDEAAQHVYGCNYSEWKKRHATKATDDQMQRYNESKPKWAKHDKELLATRAEKPAAPPVKAMAPSQTTEVTPSASTSLLSNVCCQDVEDQAIVPSKPAPIPPQKQPAKQTRTLAPFQPPPAPNNGVSFTLGILTVSDRAAKDEYETGDLSGPAVEESVLDVCTQLGEKVTCTIVKKAIVPDNVYAIQNALEAWCDECNLILTTGGTGFGPRDVTPEATVGILDKECRGLLSFVTTECSQQQPLASLSRGTAGVRKNTMIANLPGNPKGVQEIVPILLPIVLHAVADMQLSSQ